MAVLLSAAAPAFAKTPSSFFGVMADGPLLAPPVDLHRETRLMRGAGVGSIRVAFYWREMQPAQGEPIDFARSDRIVAAAARAGVSALPVLLRAPSWATGGDAREGAVPDAAAYGAFVTEVVRRYGPRGSFWSERRDIRRLPVRQWQVWNEPDIARYWVGQPWGPTYVTLLRAGHAAIKREDSRATVVAAGVTNRSWENLDVLYRAGARGHFDAAAIHPFSGRVANVVELVRRARRTMRHHGDARKRLMLTEVSWSSAAGYATRRNAWETTERGQARRVREVLTALARQRTRLRIGGVWWFTWLSPAVGDTDSFSYAGLRRMRGGRPVSKPAYTAFKQTARRLRSR